MTHRRSITFNTFIIVGISYVFFFIHTRLIHFMVTSMSITDVFGSRFVRTRETDHVSISLLGSFSRETPTYLISLLKTNSVKPHDFLLWYLTTEFVICKERVSSSLIL